MVEVFQERNICEKVIIANAWLCTCFLSHDVHCIGIQKIASEVNHDRDIGLALLSTKSKKGHAENKKHFQNEHPDFSWSTMVI